MNQDFKNWKLEEDERQTKKRRARIEYWITFLYFFFGLIAGFFVGIDYADSTREITSIESEVELTSPSAEAVISTSAEAVISTGDGEPLIEWEPPSGGSPSTNLYRITHYGPTGYGVARDGRLPEEWERQAISDGLGGICAVSMDTPWYYRVRENPPVVLRVSGHGTFLVVDRTSERIRNTIDIFGLNRDRGTEKAKVTEVSQ